MRSIRNILITSLVVIFLVSEPAYAGCSSISCDGVGSAALKRVMPVSGGEIYLVVPSATEGAKLNCTLKGGEKMVIKATNPNRNAYLATLMTGIALGQQIRIRIVEGSTDCEVANVWMDA